MDVCASWEEDSQWNGFLYCSNKISRVFGKFVCLTVFEKCRHIELCVYIYAWLCVHECVYAYFDSNCMSLANQYFLHKVACQKAVNEP